MNWIKTSERLPEIGVQVVVSESNGHKEIAVLEQGEDENSKFWNVEEAIFLFELDIFKYWAELPPLPEEQGK